MEGTIKKVMEFRGYGFIKVDDQSDDIFFHRSQLSNELRFEDLREGTKVNFEIESTPKGPQAVSISPA